MKPATIERHCELNRVDVGQLETEQLLEHVQEAQQHWYNGFRQHHVLISHLACNCVSMCAVCSFSVQLLASHLETS